jgi:hypothetical protein
MTGVSATDTKRVKEVRREQTVPANDSIFHVCRSFMCLTKASMVAITSNALRYE